MYNILFISLSVVFGFVGGIIGYYIGFRKGTIHGMQQFLSILKVYSPDTIEIISSELNRVSKMSVEDKENALFDYLEKYGIK